MKKTFTLLVLFGIFLISCCNDDYLCCHPFPYTNCDLTSQIIEEEEFNEVTIENYFITEVILNGDCLEITFGASGCSGDTWKTNLYSTDAFYAVFPLQRAVKLELINMEECLAVFQKTVSFDLTPFRIEGQNELPLNIEGWEEQILYQY